jgi:hypothetical protein
MRTNRHAVAALGAGAALLVSGGAALAGQGDGDRGARCEARLAKIAERRGITVAELQAQVKARLLTRVDAALAAGRISSERAADLRARIGSADLCARPGHGHARIGVRASLASAARYLGLTRQELRQQLPGTSLAALAAKHGKSVEGLKAAMLDPAEKRLAKAVEAGRITQERANQALERLEQLVDALVAKTFPAKG